MQGPPPPADHVVNILGTAESSAGGKQPAASNNPAPLGKTELHTAAVKVSMIPSGNAINAGDGSSPAAAAAQPAASGNEGAPQKEGYEGGVSTGQGVGKGQFAVQLASPCKRSVDGAWGACYCCFRRYSLMEM